MQCTLTDNEYLLSLSLLKRPEAVWRAVKSKYSVRWDLQLVFAFSEIARKHLQNG